MLTLMSQSLRRLQSHNHLHSLQFLMQQPPLHAGRNQLSRTSADQHLNSSSLIFTSKAPHRCLPWQFPFLPHASSAPPCRSHRNATLKGRRHWAPWWSGHRSPIEVPRPLSEGWILKQTPHGKAKPFRSEKKHTEEFLQYMKNSKFLLWALAFFTQSSKIILPALALAASSCPFNCWLWRPMLTWQKWSL